MDFNGLFGIGVMCVIWSSQFVAIKPQACRLFYDLQLLISVRLNHNCDASRITSCSTSPKLNVFFCWLKAESLRPRPRNQPKSVLFTSLLTQKFTMNSLESRVSWHYGFATPVDHKRDLSDKFFIRALRAYSELCARREGDAIGKLFLSSVPAAANELFSRHRD